MAFIQAAFYSQVLQKHVAMNVLVPEAGKGPFPVFYLLHGLSDDHTIWHRHTRIEWYVRDLPLIVVMPDGFRGFYTDSHAGAAYGKYMVEDVVGFTERTFPAARRRSGRCIGGLSMGGYGSLRLGLSRPDLFASITSHSGAIMPWKRAAALSRESEFYRIFGPKPTGTDHDIFTLAAKAKRAGKLPKIRIDCGTDDTLLQQNRQAHERFVQMKIPHEYAEFPGTHNWDYWNTHIRDALIFHCQALGVKGKS
jgi:S-formylglutathione hydrolase FrmB